MHLAYTDEQEELRRTLRSYYAELLTPEVRALLDDPETHEPTKRKVVKQMAADGWLGIGWPSEWGGKDRGPIDQWLLYDESMRQGAPLPILTINTVGAMIMHLGSRDEKGNFLPRVLE